MKKILSFLLVLIMCVALLASCNILGPGGTENPGGEGGENQTPSDEEVVLGEGETIIYSPSVAVSVIKSSDANYKGFDFTGLVDAIYVYSNKFALLNSDLSPVSGTEIIVGETSRELTAKAMEKLETSISRFKRNLEDMGDTQNVDFIEGYGFYCEDGAIAVVWSNDLLAPKAYEYLIENFICGSTLVVADGYTNMQSLNMLDVYEEEEEARRQEKYAVIEADYGPEVVTAIKNHLLLFDDRFYTWLANLYDPGEYDEDGNPLGGGFYYSNSGRDTPGFGIDIESTNQALGFLGSSGMRDGYSAAQVIPEKMQKEILTFVINCQSSLDGYFYHPQWGTAVATSRISRDLSWAESILKSFGAKPNWNTPTNMAGIYGAPGVNAVQPLEGKADSAVSAVSKLIPTNSAWTGSKQLSTIDEWKAYVASYGETIRKSSYSHGNNFSSQSSQIKSRDALAIKTGELPDANNDGRADGGFIETWEYYFNSWQLEYNGLWEHNKTRITDPSDATKTIVVDDPNGEHYYNQINGLMKISGAYNSLGLKYPNADKAVEAAIAMVYHNDEENDLKDVMGKAPNCSVDVYNPWVALNTLINNINTYGDKNEAAAVRKQLQDNAVEMIRITTVKCSKFIKDDGSYGYTWTSSPANSQGAPVAVPNTIEGDINGGVIALTGTYGSMMGALGISQPKPYGYSEMLKFLQIIENNSPVVKEDATLIEVNPLDFEDYVIGGIESDEVEGLNIGGLGTNGKAEIVDGGEGHGNALKVTTVDGSGQSLTVNAAQIKGAQSLVLEFDIKFDTITKGQSTAFQIMLGSPYSYMITLGVTTGGVLTVGDSSSTGNGVKNSFKGNYDAFDWNSIKVEFYILDSNEKSTMAKIFVNGNLRYTSTNYYGAEKNATPGITYKTAYLYALNATVVDVCFDNVYAYQSEKGYVEEAIVDPDRNKNFDGSTSLPKGVTTSGGVIVADPTEDNPKNNIFVMSGASDTVTVSASNAQGGANVHTFNAKMKIDAESDGTIGTLYLSPEDSAKSFAAYRIVVYTDNGEQKARLVEVNSAGKTGETINGLPVGTWFELKIEFYPYFYLEGNSTIAYVDGIEVGRGSMYYTINFLARALSNAIIVKSSGATLSLDNIIVESVKKTYVDKDGNNVADPDVELPAGGKGTNTPVDSTHTGNFDFEDCELGLPKVPGLQTIPNVNFYGTKMEIAVDPLDAANKVLMHKVTGNGGNSSYFTSGKNVEAGNNCLVVSYDLLSTGCSGYFQMMVQGNVAGKENATVFELSMGLNGNWASSSGGTINLRTKSETTSLNLRTIKDGVKAVGWINLRFEVYKDKGITQIYVDNVLVGETDVLVTANLSAQKLTRVQFYHTYNSEGTVYIDNVMTSSIVKQYTPMAQ